MPSPQMPKAKAQFLRQILRPLVRLCFRNACSAYEVIEAVKAVFIELAVDQIKAGGNKITASRLSVMTGIDRRDVKRIYAGDGMPESQPSLVTRVLGQWENDPHFSSRGRPRVLSYKGEDSEFKSLVASISKDMNPATMLFELQRLGLVERVGDDVKLLGAVNYYAAEPEKKFAVLSRNFETLGLASEENLFEDIETKNLNLRTEFDNIRPADLPKIRAWLVKHGTQFHDRARAFLSKFDEDVRPRGKKRSAKRGATVVLGSFSWTSNQDKDLAGR